MEDGMTALAEAVLFAYEDATKNKRTWWNAADDAAEKVGFDTRGTSPIYLMLKSQSNRKEAVLWAKTVLKR